MSHGKKGLFDFTAGYAYSIIQNNLRIVYSVLCIDILEHIKNDEQVLEAISAKLNDGGKLLLLAPAHKRLYGIRDREMGHLRRYSREEIRRKMMRCGYTILKMRSWNLLGVIPYFISEKIFRRRINERVRYARRNLLAAMLNFLLSKWFALVENHLSFGVGLSLFIVAEKSRLEF